MSKTVLSFTGRNLIFVLLGLFLAVLGIENLGIPFVSAQIYRNVNTDELVNVALEDLQVQYDAINEGKATSPFEDSPDAVYWHEHSKQVVSRYRWVSHLINADIAAPLSVNLISAHRIDNWFEPRIEISIAAQSKCFSETFTLPDESIPFGVFCDPEREPAYDSLLSEYIISFHQVDGTWQVRAVWSPAKYFSRDNTQDTFFNRYCRNDLQPDEEQCASDQGRSFL